MRLAADIVIRIDGEALRLRPTLRAATRLDHRFGGLDRLDRAIGEGSVSALAAVLVESSVTPIATERFVAWLMKPGLFAGLAAVIEPVNALMRAMTGADEPAPKATGGKRRKPAKPITFAEYHEQLFGLATGWLGWPPETAWNATPAEIRVAFAAHLDMLKAIHGSGEKGKPDDGLTQAERFRMSVETHNVKRSALASRKAAA